MSIREPAAWAGDPSAHSADGCAVLWAGRCIARLSTLRTEYDFTKSTIVHGDPGSHASGLREPRYRPRAGHCTAFRDLPIPLQ